MRLAQLRLQASLWAKELWSRKALDSLLSSFGALWLFIEIAEFFLEETKVPGVLRDVWWIFLLIGGVLAITRCKPRTSVVHKISGRDVSIRIVVGNVFAQEGALIVGSNTTFDTRLSRKLIVEESIQGAFTKKYYYGNAELIDQQIEKELQNVPFRALLKPREGKCKKYPIGTVVRLDKESRTAYLVAITDMNEHGVAGGSFENLKDSLASLWVFIGSRGLKEPLAMPVLGTGFSRLPQTREEVIREIVRSFVAACSERVITDSLTIVISPKDLINNKISLVEVGKFVAHSCSYANNSGPRVPAVGEPI